MSEAAAEEILRKSIITDRPVPGPNLAVLEAFAGTLTDSAAASALLDFTVGISVTAEGTQRVAWPDWTLQNSGE